MPTQAFSDKRLSLRDIRVLGAICACVDKNTRSNYIKRETLKEIAALPKNHISESTNRLVDFGYIEKSGNGGRSRSSFYRVLDPVNSDQNGKGLTRNGDQNSQGFIPETVTDLASNPDQIGKGHIQRIYEDNPIAQAQDDSQLPFDHFWESYPKKKDKKKSRAVWGRKKLDSKADHIIADVNKRKRQDRQWLGDPKYIPYPSTYLNGERWDDEFESALVGDKRKVAI